MPYGLGVAISTLIKLIVLPQHGIDMDLLATESEGEAASRLAADEAQFALLADPGRVADQLRSYADGVVAFWRIGEDDRRRCN